MPGTRAHANPAALIPQRLDAERVVLGSILINNHAFYRIIGHIDTDDFFKEAHRAIFAAMRRLAEQSCEIEPLALTAELREQNQLEEAGGTAYIASLLEAAPDLAIVERCVNTIKAPASA
jgi:replicative DNA helicase